MIKELEKKIANWPWPELEDLLSILTLILLIKHAPDQWYARGPVNVICITGLVFRSLTRMTNFWMCLAAVLASVLWSQWPWLDNHKYLEFYWVLSLACVYSCPAEVRRKYLRLNASFLLGGCMLLAVIWKALSVDYLEGSFFNYTLLTDPRFETFSALLSGLEDSVLSNNRMLLKEGAQQIQLVSSQRMDFFSHLLTWWTILIEASIGLLFLLGCKKDQFRIIGTWILIIFVVSTYAVATVKGFAWLLLLFALAQTLEKERLLQLSLILIFLLVQIYTLPFGQVTEALGY